jgi:CheY-like chemotaxis protein
MDGIEMISHFRTIKNDLKVIWMSAYLPPEKNRPSESDPVLKKPFTSDELLQTVKTVF